jgi:hypothetical protein
MEYALYIRCALYIHLKECRKNLGCALSTGKYGITYIHTLPQQDLIFKYQKQFGAFVESTDFEALQQVLSNCD